MSDLLQVLRDHGIQATPQRLAVAEYVLATDTHPSADEVWEEVRKSCPTLSRATVYNTLNTLVERGLLRAQKVREGAVVFDPHVERHHHFVDEATGRVYDVPWDAISVSVGDRLEGFEVSEYQVVLRGRRTAR